MGTDWWPNQDFRKGDFSLLLNPSINPATGHPVRAPIVIYDPVTGLPFNGNIIPANHLHPGTQNVIGKYLPLSDFQQIDPLDFTASRAIPSIIGARQHFGSVDHTRRRPLRGGHPGRRPARLDLEDRLARERSLGTDAL